MNDSRTKVIKNRTILLIAGTIGLLFAGILYAWSILKVPLSTEFGWTSNQLATSYTITISMFCLGCIAGGFVMKRTSPKISVLIGAVLVFGGFYLTSTLDGSSIFKLYIYYGAFAGFGIGMAYNTILASIGAWFPDKKGFSTGVLMMGFGASTLVLGNICGSLINSPDVGWRKVFILLALSSGLAMLLVGLLIKLPTPNDDLPKAKVAQNSNKDTFEIQDLKPGEMLKRISFWKFFIAMSFLGAAGSSLISFARDFSLSVGVSAELAGIFVGVLSVANGLGRIIAGALYDKFGRSFIMWFVSVLEIVACALCILTIVTQSAVICILAFIFVGLSYGGNTNAVSVFINSFYGNKYYSQNLSFGLLSLLPGATLAKLSTVIFVSSGGYLVPFAVLLVYGVLALILHLSNKRP